MKKIISMIILLLSITTTYSQDTTAATQNVEYYIYGNLTVGKTLYRGTNEWEIRQIIHKNGDTVVCADFSYKNGNGQSNNMGFIFFKNADELNEFARALRKSFVNVGTIMFLSFNNKAFMCVSDKYPEYLLLADDTDSQILL